MVINGRDYNYAELEAYFKELEIVYENQYMVTYPEVKQDDIKNFLCSKAKMILYLANGKLFICDSYSKLEAATDISVQKYPLIWAWAIDSSNGIMAHGRLCEAFQTELALSLSICRREDNVENKTNEK